MRRSGLHFKRDVSPVRCRLDLCARRAGITTESPPGPDNEPDTGPWETQELRPSVDMLSSQRRFTGRKRGDLPAWPLWVCHSPSEDHAGQPAGPGARPPEPGKGHASRSHMAQRECGPRSPGPGVGGGVSDLSDLCQRDQPDFFTVTDGCCPGG